MSVSHSRIRVRYAETDQMGVVYHANYFVWFEVGRVDLLRQAGFDYKQMELTDGCGIAVVEAACRYKAPAHYDDELLIETRVEALHGSVLKFAYRVLREDRDGDGVSPLLLAEGRTSHVAVTRNMERSRLPEKYAAALRAFMEPARSF